MLSVPRVLASNNEQGICSEEEALANCHSQFEGMLEYVSRDAQDREIHEAEEGIFRRLMQLGLSLLALYLAKKGIGKIGKFLQVGSTLFRSHGTKDKTYRSIFGLLEVRRAYYYLKGKGGACPLDAELNLRPDGYSRLLCKWANFLSIKQAFGKVSEFFEKFLGRQIWTGPLEKLSRTAAEDAEAFRQTAKAPVVSDSADLLILSVDGKGVPMRRSELDKDESKKKMSIVWTSYGVKRFVRTADDFMRGAWRFLAESFDGTEEPEHPVSPKPEGKRVGATLKGKQKAFEMMWEDAEARDPMNQKTLVVLVDGERALHNLIEECFPHADAVILDLVHVMTYMWAAGNALFGESTDESKQWVGERIRSLLEGKVGRVIGGLRQILTKRKLSKAQRKAIMKAVNYFNNYRDKMKYDEYLAAGYPVATGVVEGACRHLVKDRMELGGMRWTVDGAEAVLALRAIEINGEWDDFWKFRCERDRERLYGDFQVPWDTVPSSVA